MKFEEIFDDQWHYFQATYQNDMFVEYGNKKWRPLVNESINIDGHDMRLSTKQRKFVTENFIDFTQKKPGMTICFSFKVAKSCKPNLDNILMFTPETSFGSK